MAKKDEEDEEIPENEDEQDDDESSDDKDDSGSKKKESKEEDEIEVVLEDDDKDEKIAVKKNREYSEEDIEEKRARRRAEKKRKRHQDYLNRQAVRKLSEENSELKKRLDAVEKIAPRINAQEEMSIDNAITSQIALYKNAEAQMEKAITEGNGAVAKDAQRVMFDANNKYTQLVALKQKYKDDGVSVREIEKKEEKKPEIGEAHKMYASRWMKENDWFDPHGDDEDSETARIVDKQLMSEGYDPNRREFWDEFKDRLKDELPHVFEEKPKKSAAPRPKQTNGSLGADSSTNSAQTIKIPQRVKQMAIDAGQWDDPRLKKIFVRNWVAQQANGKAN